jgi:hypothetical protein
MRKRILTAVGVVAVAAAIAVPVVMAAATPSPTVQPAVTAKPVTDDKGGQTKAKNDTATTRTTRREAEPGDDKGGAGEVEPGDDKGGAGEVEPGDDKGKGGDDD